MALAAFGTIPHNHIHNYDLYSILLLQQVILVLTLKHATSKVKCYGCLHHCTGLLLYACCLHFWCFHVFVFLCFFFMPKSSKLVFVGIKFTLFYRKTQKNETQKTWKLKNMNSEKWYKTRKNEPNKNNV